MSRPKEFSPAQLAVFNERYGNNIEKTNVDLTEKYIIDGIVPRDGLTILAGAAKAGKTTLAMQLIHDIITQKTFLNKRIIHNEKNSTKCLYITNEDSASVCFSRLMAIFGDDAGIEAVDIAAEVPFRYASGGLLDFIEMKTEFGYNLFIIDNFRSFGIDSGIERDFTGARLTERMRWMTDMCKELHISIILIHHTKKDSGNRGRNAADEFAGSNVISSVSDSNIILSRTREQNRLVLHCESKIKSDENLVLTRSSSLSASPPRISTSPNATPSGKNISSLASTLFFKKSSILVRLLSVECPIYYTLQKKMGLNCIQAVKILQRIRKAGQLRFRLTDLENRYTV